MNAARSRPLGQLSACAGAMALACAPCLRGQDLPTAPAPQSPALVKEHAATSAQLAGEVLSDDGAIISGAQISLVATSGNESAHAVTDASGHYALTAIAPGSYTVTIALPGFTTSTQSVDLQPGQTLNLGPVRLGLATVNISVDAISPEQAGIEQLHAEEHQRLVGLLPNFFVSYNWVAPPMTARQKFTLATHNVLDPGNLALVGTVAGVQQATNAFPGYRQGAKGYGRRYGADLANLVAGSYMGGAVLPSLFHQDPRYFYKGTGTIRSRVLYALSRSVITRGDNGRDQPNFSGILGDLSAGAISNIYYPASDRQGATLFLENGFLGIAGDAMNDIVQEFVLPRFTTKGKKAKAQP